MKIKLIALCLLLFTFFGCKDCRECIEENNVLRNKLSQIENLNSFTSGVQNSETKNLSFCDENFQILAKESKYNTETGIANLKLIVPKGHKIMNQHNNKNHVFIKTFGNSIGNDVDTLDVEVNYLSKRKKNILGVHVKYTFDDKSNNCSNKEIHIEGEKDKGSIIVGAPFHGESKN